MPRSSAPKRARGTMFAAGHVSRAGTLWFSSWSSAVVHSLLLAFRSLLLALASLLPALASPRQRFATSLLPIVGRACSFGSPLLALGDAPRSFEQLAAAVRESAARARRPPLTFGSPLPAFASLQLIFVSPLLKFASLLPAFDSAMWSVRRLRELIDDRFLAFASSLRSFASLPLSFVSPLRSFVRLLLSLASALRSFVTLLRSLASALRSFVGLRRHFVSGAVEIGSAELNFGGTKCPVGVFAAPVDGRPTIRAAANGAFHNDASTCDGIALPPARSHILSECLRVKT